MRQKRVAEAIPELEAASRLAPESARYAYVYAVALGGTGRTPQAIAALEGLLARHPNDRDALSALVAYEREQKRPREALAAPAAPARRDRAGQCRGAPARRAARGGGPTLSQAAPAAGNARR